MGAIRIAAVVVCSLVIVQLVAPRQEHKKQELCGNGKIKLFSIYDLERTTTEECPNHVKKAFGALKALVEEPNVCSMDKATNIVRFFEDHLRGSNWQASKSKAQTLIEKFVVAYGFQASYICRLSLARDFYDTAHERLKSSDFKALKEWTRSDSPVARLLSSITKNGDFLLPSEFSALSPDVVSKLKMKMSESSDQILLAQEVCKKRFRPLYEPVILPLAYLARNGLCYHHRFPDLSFTVRFEARKFNTLWSRIVFVCESLKEIEVVEEPTGSATQSGEAATSGQARVAKSPIEMPLVRSYALVSPISGFDEDGKYNVKLTKKFHLYSSANLRLRSVMNSYNVTMSETERFRKRVLSNKWGLLIATFKSNEQTKTLLKKAFQMKMAALQRKRHQDQELESAKKDMLGLLDAKKNSTIFRIFAKILRGGKELLVLLAALLELVMILTVAITASVTIVVDLVALVVDLEPNLTDKLMDFFNGL